jgi:hypothetical protein
LGNQAAYEGLNKLRVLLIEDNDEYATIISQHLRQVALSQSIPSRQSTSRFVNLGVCGESCKAVVHDAIHLNRVANEGTSDLGSRGLTPGVLTRLKFLQNFTLLDGNPNPIAKFVAIRQVLRCFDKKTLNISHFS